MEDVSASYPGASPPLPPERTSPWAIASLMCALAVACPILPMVAPLLGLKAFAHMRSTPGIGGARVAAAGIIIGVTGTVLWIGFAYLWHVEARTPIIEGPIRELRSGLANDVRTFKAGFTEPGRTLPDAEAAAFLSEVASRYGRLHSIQQDVFRPDPEPGVMSPVIPYVFQFEAGLRQAEAKIVLLADGLSSRWESIVILDDEEGDLSYPPGIPRLPEPVGNGQTNGDGITDEHG